MSKPNLRSIACEIAKKLAKEKGGTPNKHMKEAWALAKEGKVDVLETSVIKFFSVKYKGVKGNHSRSIVPAENPEMACRKFYDPDDPNGPKNEILDIVNPKKIPQGWTVAFRYGKNGIGNAHLTEDFLLNGKGKLNAKFKGEPIELKVEDIIAANPPKKVAVMR
jgi:hypothetical protein